MVKILVSSSFKNITREKLCFKIRVFSLKVALGSTSTYTNRSPLQLFPFFSHPMVGLGSATMSAWMITLSPATPMNSVLSIVTLGAENKGIRISSGN